MSFLEEIRPFVVVKGEQIDTYIDTLKHVPLLGLRRASGSAQIIEAGAARLRLLKRGSGCG